MAPAEVTGSISLEDLRSRGEVTYVDDVGITSGWELSNRWEASDPRLSGTSIEATTWHRYPQGFTVVSTTFGVENDDGRWVGTSTGMEGSGFFTDTAVLHGEGAYEGLTAYLMMDLARDAGTIRGLVVADDLPPFPEPAAE